MSVMHHTGPGRRAGVALATLAHYGDHPGVRITPVEGASDRAVEARGECRSTAPAARLQRRDSGGDR